MPRSARRCWPNIALDFGDSAGVKEIFPYPLPDLFAGEQLVAVGRYEEGGKVDVELKGDVNGKERLYVYPSRDLVSSGGEPFVAKLWATRRIGELLSQVRRTGAEQELIDEIVDLSLRYGIVTPYTSYLVLEPGDYVPQPVTAGVMGGSAPPAAPRAAALDAAEGGSCGGRAGGSRSTQRRCGGAGQRGPQQLGKRDDGDAG